MKILLLVFVLLMPVSDYAQQANHKKSTSIRKKKKSRVQEAKVYVCYSRSAYAYHTYYCHGLNRCRSGTGAVSVSEARNMGYVPCKICY